MSGVEVIRLVLGGLLLIFSFAEHYREGFEPLVRWKRFRFDFQKFITTVDTQEQMFKLTLTNLLAPVQLEPEEKQKLLTMPDYEGWHRSDVVEALRSRLGDTYVLAWVDWAVPGKNQWEYQIKRLQLSFSENGTRTVQSLEKQIRDLDRLLERLDGTNHPFGGMKTVSKAGTATANKLRSMAKSKSKKILRFVPNLGTEPKNSEGAKHCLDASQQSCLVTPPPPPPPPPLTKERPDVNIKINDLCSTMKGLDPNVEFFGCLSDNEHQEHEVRWIKDTRQARPSLGEISLDKLLTSNGHLKLSR
ncbi:hypothetical protein VE00_08629 [Pseudogymnoascus sp. WSF 3629]|nr:hypothetical protein VE00_08629 [Pseudogymnoascus sp. WSF 3629]